MRWILTILSTLVIFLIGGFFYLKGYPYKKYSQWIYGQGYDQFYKIKNYQQLYLKPTGFDDIPEYQEDYVQLWKDFQIGNSLIPLPTRHPMFQTVPIIELKKNTNGPSLGVILLDPSQREISRIYTLPNSVYQDFSQGQKIFNLPYFKKRIFKKGLDELWVDIFSYEIEPKKKSLDEMIYDLYLLHLRSKLLPKETIRYGLIKDGKQAMIELVSPDKDYMLELIMTQQNGSIFSYVLRTEKDKIESRRLRGKFLESISFSPIDEAMGRILYTEFKQLNFSRQVDQEGMLYLFAAWSQTPDNDKLLKEMIYYLERGQNSKEQLKAIYAYAYKRYGKTFTSRNSVEEQDDPEISLQRKIEIEEREKRKAAEGHNLKIPVNPELSPDEKMDSYLREAKKNKSQKKDEMVIH